MEVWWNDTDRGKLMFWNNTFYSLCGGNIDVRVVDGWMGMEQLWKRTDRGKLEALREKHYKAWVVDE